MSEHTFDEGDVVTEKSEYSLRGKGEVVSVDREGYVDVRFNDGQVFSFWPVELVFVGKLDPEFLPALRKIDKTIEDAQSTIYKLKDIRKGLMTLAIEKMETDG